MVYEEEGEVSKLDAYKDMKKSLETATDPRDVRTLEMINDLEHKARIKNHHIKLNIKVGRNAPCPCGSEKKFKKCCNWR